MTSKSQKGEKLKLLQLFSLAKAALLVQRRDKNHRGRKRQHSTDKEKTEGNPDRNRRRNRIRGDGTKI